MAADSSKDAVYLEDIQLEKNKKRKKADDEEEVPKVANKRQVTLTSMFASGAAVGNNAVKKGKATSSTSTATAATTTVTTAKKAGLQRLNSIPFSLSGFVESLTDEQKRLLALECEVLGKSWQVATIDYNPDAWSIANLNCLNSIQAQSPQRRDQETVFSQAQEVPLGRRRSWC
jgi:hypothetical protein